jgi:hypothetical protein
MLPLYLPISPLVSGVSGTTLTDLGLYENEVYRVPSKGDFHQGHTVPTQVESGYCGLMTGQIYNIYCEQ